MSELSTNCLKNHQIENLFKKKRNKSLFQQYFNTKLSKYRFLTIFGKLEFGKMGFGKLVLNLAF